MIRRPSGWTGVEVPVIGQGTWMIERPERRAVEALRLGLDLYLLHWAGTHPIRETMRAMEKLVAEGMTRFIGVSNFDVEDLRGAEAALRNERLACDQVLYHLGDRGIERRLIPYCRERQIAVVGYSPFGHRGFRDGPVVAGRTPRQAAPSPPRTATCRSA